MDKHLLGVNPASRSQGTVAVLERGTEPALMALRTGGGVGGGLRRQGDGPGAGPALLPGAHPPLHCPPISPLHLSCSRPSLASPVVTDVKLFSFRRPNKQLLKNFCRTLASSSHDSIRRVRGGVQGPARGPGVFRQVIGHPEQTAELLTPCAHRPGVCGSPFDRPCLRIPFDRTCNHHIARCRFIIIYRMTPYKSISNYNNITKYI